MLLKYYTTKEYMLLVHIYRADYKYNSTFCVRLSNHILILERSLFNMPTFVFQPLSQGRGKLTPFRIFALTDLILEPQ